MFSISVLSSTDPLLRDITTLCVADQMEVLTCDLTADSVVLVLTTPDATGWEREIPLAHPCITCSLREAIVPTLAELARDAHEHDRAAGVLLALPVAIEPLNVIPALEDLTGAGETLAGCVLTGSVHALDLTTTPEDLLHHMPLAERGLALFEDDERCTGEVLMNSIGYADLLVTVGEDDLGSDLVEHLRALDTLRLDHLDGLSRDLLLGGRHDSEVAVGRIHPARTRAWGGPTTHGVWTLDLHSDRPFHPLRLAERVSELSVDGTCARGCFWLPSRPRTVCTWDVNGSTVSVGTAGTWDTEPFTHLIVTGATDEAIRSRIETTFSELLMTSEELDGALAWVGRDDGLGSWFSLDDPLP